MKVSAKGSIQYIRELQDRIKGLREDIEKLRKQNWDLNEQLYEVMNNPRSLCPLCSGVFVPCDKHREDLRNEKK